MKWKTDWLHAQLPIARLTAAKLPTANLPTAMLPTANLPTAMSPTAKLMIPAVVILSLILASQTAYALQDSNSDTLIHRLTELKKSGAPLKFADLAKANIADEKNAAAALENMKSRLIEFEKTMFEQGLDFLEQPPNKKSIQAFVELDAKHDYLTDDLRSLSECQVFYPDLGLESNPAPDSLAKVAFRKLSLIRSVARILQAKTKVAMAQGNTNEAMEIALDLLQIARLCDESPFLIGRTIAAACHSMGLYATNEILQNNGISPELRSKLDKQLSEYETRSGKACLESERVFALEKLKNSPAKAKISILNFFEMAIANASKTSLEYKKMLEEMDREAYRKMHDVYSSTLTPAIEASRGSNDRNLALARCLRILNRIQQEEIRSESELGRLKLIPDVLIDPYSDKQLLVKKSKNGWKVYSVSRNGKDDQGESDDVGTWSKTKDSTPKDSGSDEESNRQLIAKSVEQLIALQEKDGAWPYEGVYRVRGKIPVGYRIGGTAIVCTSLLYCNSRPVNSKSEAPESDPNGNRSVHEAIERGTKLILKELEDPLMRPSVENRYDVRVWGHIYALDFFCHLQNSKNPAFTKLADDVEPWIQKLTDYLIKEEIDGGGWNYANHRQHACFVTAPAIQALLRAKYRGAKVPDAVFFRGRRALEKSRTPDGAYQYSGVLGERRPAKLPGSIARSANCETTLLLLGGGSRKNLRASIDAFHKHWDELEKRRKKTGTHKPPYNVAPYYFYYGHRYLAQAIRMLPAEQQSVEIKKFNAVLLKTKDKDNTWNDRVFDRSKAFGTAMSIMSLDASVPMPPSLKDLQIVLDKK